MVGWNQFESITRDGRTYSHFPQSHKFIFVDFTNHWLSDLAHKQFAWDSTVAARSPTLWYGWGESCLKQTVCRHFLFFLAGSYCKVCEGQIFMRYCRESQVRGPDVLLLLHETKQNSHQPVIIYSTETPSCAHIHDTQNKCNTPRPSMNGQSRSWAFIAIVVYYLLYVSDTDNIRLSGL